MKLSKSYFVTYKENVKDEDSISANLLVRTGMVKKTGSGIYTFLPLGLKVLRKIENETVSKVEPIKVICPNCGENMEVEVSPSMTFWQGDDDL